MKKLILTLGLTNVGMTKKIDAIKALRATLGWGLREAKDLADSIAASPNNTRRVIMTAEQVALLDHLYDPECCFYFDAAQLYEEPEALDLTGRPSHLVGFVVGMPAAA